MDDEQENQDQGVGSGELLAALHEYRCQYTLDENGDGLALIDVLSQNHETIAEGKNEMELLAEHIHCAVFGC